MNKTQNTPTTVRNASYGDITGPHGLLARRIPFSGNSMSADIYQDGTYHVFSYGTEIARRGPRGKIMLNTTKYSATTSRHQHACAAWLQGNTPTYVDGVHRGGFMATR